MPEIECLKQMGSFLMQVPIFPAHWSAWWPGRAAHAAHRGRCCPSRCKRPRLGAAIAWRYRKRANGCGVLEPVRHVGAMQLSDLQNIDGTEGKNRAQHRAVRAGPHRQQRAADRARGTGKSSLIRACLHAYARQGLRLIEVDKADLTDLPDIVEVVAGAPENFIIYCDDLSFEEGEPRLQGHEVHPGRLGQRRHAQRAGVRHQQPPPPAARVHERQPANLQGPGRRDPPGEVVEEKISLSERFGLWVSFYPFSQDEYLRVVAQWLSSLGLADGADRSGQGLKPWSGRWSVARAVAAWPSSLRATMPAAALRGRQQPRPAPALPT